MREGISAPPPPLLPLCLERRKQQLALAATLAALAAAKLIMRRALASSAAALARSRGGGGGVPVLADAAPSCPLIAAACSPSPTARFPGLPVFSCSPFFAHNTRRVSSEATARFGATSKAKAAAAAAAAAKAKAATASSSKSSQGSVAAADDSLEGCQASDTNVYLQEVSNALLFAESSKSEKTMEERALLFF